MASLSIARADPLAPARIVGRACLILAAALLCVPLHFLSKALFRRSNWPRRFLWMVARACGAVVRTVGKRVADDVFYVANHQSWFDIPVLAGASGAAFVSKDSVKHTPVVGWFASLNNTVFIARDNKLGVAEQIEAIRAAIAEHQPIAIFPEGTTGDGEGLLPFKPSLLAAMAPPPKPMRVQPVLIDYGEARRDVAWVGDEPALDNVRRLLGRRGGFAATVSFLEPFDPSDYPDRKAIAAEARRRILTAFAASPDEAQGV